MVLMMLLTLFVMDVVSEDRGIDGPVTPDVSVQMPEIHWVGDSKGLVSASRLYVHPQVTLKIDLYPFVKQELVT